MTHTEHVHIDLGERSYDIAIGAGLIDNAAAWQGLPMVLAGNAMAVHEKALQQLVHACHAEPVTVWPEARAMLLLATQAWQRGEAVAAEHAMPVYVRDEVARTTAERLADKAANA